jgi:hypothetical protein
MKQLLVLFSVLVFASCSTAPDSKIHNQKLEKGGWVYDSNVSKPVQEEIEYVQIAPTWSQAFYYAGKRTDRPVTVGLAIILFVIFVALFYAKSSEASWFPKYLNDKMIIFNALLFLFLAGSVSIYMSHPSGIKWNNDKWIEKSVFDKTIQESGSTQPIWDSLENKCFIVDGPYGCYTK